jgi:hypothetical protein
MLTIKTRTNPRGLKKALRRFPAEVSGVSTEAAGEYLVGNNRRGLKHYAKRRPLQKYIRTYTLRRNWMSKREGTKTQVSNKTAYAGFVQGLKQAWMHAGRWRTWLKVAQDNEKGMLRAAELAINRLLKEKGLL